MHTRSPLTIVLFTLPLTLTLALGAGCSGDDGSSSASATETSTTTAGETDATSTSTSTSTSGGSESDSQTTTTTTGGSTDATTTGETTTGETTTTTGGDLGANSCLVVINCADACGDVECVDACIADGSENGAAEAESIILCAASHGCGDDEACLTSNCLEELLTCSSGDATCSELSDCSETCDGEPTCEANCYSEATTLAQAELTGLGECIAENDCQDDACVLQECGPQVGECFSGGADVLECPSLFGCIADCGEDPLCHASCRASGTPSAVTEVGELVACSELNDCQDESCLEEKCGDAWNSCLWGQGDCTAGWTCAVACGGGEVCLSNCYAMTEESSFPPLVALGACAVENECNDEECINANCADEATACFAP